MATQSPLIYVRVPTLQLNLNAQLLGGMLGQLDFHANREGSEYLLKHACDKFVTTDLVGFVLFFNSPFCSYDSG